MPRYLILAQSEVSADALAAWLDVLGEQPLCPRDPRRIVWDRSAVDDQGWVKAYEALAERVETAARDSSNFIPLNQVTVLVDNIKPESLTAVLDGGGWDNVVAMLIQSFPEMRWIFGFVPRCDDRVWQSLEMSHSLRTLLSSEVREPLLDPTGLRQWVRQKSIENRQGEDFELPERIEMAAAIDEEKPYAYLHAYTAYRFGYRSDVITSWSLMQARFADHGKPPSRHDYWLLLEDMSLNFPDKESKTHLSRLEAYRSNGQNEQQGRAAHCRRLDADLLDSEKQEVENSKIRALITSGQGRPGDWTLSKNREYLYRTKKGRGLIIFKPPGGMFDLWKKLGLGTHNAPGFEWPPARPRPLDNAKEGGGHSAPGKLLLVAEHLIRRSEAIAKTSTDACHAVQGAVLATDALELTGLRTPTTAIEALSLKHQLEVTAECQFSGVQHHFALTARLDEIRRDVSRTVEWFAPTQRAAAAINGEMNILNMLLRVFRQYGQFDEEQICLNRMRCLQSTMWMSEGAARLLFWPFIRYIEYILSTLPRFLVCFFLWILGLTLLFASVADPLAPYIDRLIRGFEYTMTSFLSFGQPFGHGSAREFGGWTMFVILLSIMSGFVHLGVLISHLYVRIARR